MKLQLYSLSHFTLASSQQKRELTDFDVLGIELADFPLQSLQTSLDPAGSPEHQSRFHLDAQEDVAGMPGEVGKLVDNVGQRVTADLVQRREQHGSAQPASPTFFGRSPAIPRREPTNAPRLDASLVKGHILFHSKKEKQ